MEKAIGRKFLFKAWSFHFHWPKDRAAGWALAFTGLVVMFLMALYYLFLAPAGGEEHSKIVAIPAGSGFHDISRILEEKGIIRSRRSFYLLARLEGAIPKVKAGEYEFFARMTPFAVLGKIVRGDFIKYPITIPEGFNLFQIGGVLEEAGVCDKKFFLEKAKESSFIVLLGLEGDSLEGYLFPDTYNFPKGFGEENVIRHMVARFKTVYSSLAKRAKELGLSHQEVVILASMIEKEAADDLERRMVSAVFHNRLQRGMALQSDPTAVYGLKSRGPGERKIAREDLLKRTPYNTYHINGLPKGPIANPGLKSLEAVLYPEAVNYLYFVSKNDGTHHFSNTLEEHNRAVAKYQRRAKMEFLRKKELSEQPGG